eukprot:COSAG04_NODE_3759_length_2552_cov_2.606925_4_plen_128_part_00
MSAEPVLLGAGEPERPRGDAFFGELRTGVSSSLESSSSCDSVFGRSGSYLAGFLGVLPLRRDIVELPELAGSWLFSLGIRYVSIELSLRRVFPGSASKCRLLACGTSETHKLANAETAETAWQHRLW